MRKQVIRFTLFALLALGFSSAHAVNDDEDNPCFGSHYLGWLDAAFYWREGTTWYKLASNDFDSVYPWYGAHYGGGGDYAGEDYTCYLTANTADKETVSQASVPSICQPASSGDKDSCLVFATKQYTSDSYRYYRVYLGPDDPTNWSYVETWLGSWGQYELNQRIWGHRVYSTEGSPLVVKVYTNHTDFQNQQSTWDPSASSWSLHSQMKEAEVQIRTYIFGFGYVWIWYDTDGRTDSFKQFQVDIYKQSGLMGMGEDGGEAELLFSTALPEEEESEETGDDLPPVEGEGTVYYGDFDGLFPALFATTAPENEEDQETTSLKVETNGKGEAIAITVEHVDVTVGEEAKVLLEGRTIIAVNGIMLYDLGTIEEQILYLVTEEIVSITLVGGYL